MEKIVSKAFVIILFCLFLGIGSIAALEFDNVKSSIPLEKGSVLSIGESKLAYDDYSKLWDKYPPVQIKNAFGLGETLIMGAITENTEICLSDCASTIKLYLANEGVLIEDVRFYTLTYDNEGNEIDRVEQPMNYQIYVNDEFYKGEKLKAGTYIVKIDGKKEPNKIIDWQIKSQGEWITDWAIWGASNGLIAYYPFEDTSNNITDVIAANNLSAVGGNFVYRLPGIIGFAVNQTALASSLESINNINANATSGKTINFWYKKGGAADNNGVIYASTNVSNGGGNQVRLLMNASGTGLLMRINNADSVSLFIPPNNVWEMYTVIENISGSFLYINGTLKNSGAVATGLPPTDDISFLGGYSTFNTRGHLDEAGVWNRSLTSTEITQLYNNGAGLTYSQVVPNSPDNNFEEVPNTQVIFSSSVTTSGAINITNISLWTNYSGTWSSLNFSNLKGTTNSTTFVQTFSNIGNFVWNFKACYSPGYCEFSDNNMTLLIKNVSVKNVIYNASTFETSSENFLVNTTGTVLNANLVYDGTSYPASMSTAGIWTRTIDIPAVTSSTTKTFYWSFNSGAFNSTLTYSQTVNPIYFVICNSTINKTYVNFTFKDETANTFINGTFNPATFTFSIGTDLAESYLYTNLSINNPSYAFCFSPQDKTINTAFSLKYLYTNYPLRTYGFVGTLSNTTTNTVLYLLPSTDGIYSAIRTADAGGGAISGVTIVYERQIAGVWTVLGQEITGNDGVATFWVNPNYQYRFTASKTGYTTVQVVIQPSQSQYTITMGTGATGGYVSPQFGIYWAVYPASGTLRPQTNQNFNATVYSTYANLENCKFELLNATNTSQVLATTISITNSSYCFLSLTYSTSSDGNLFGRLSLDTTNSSGFFVVDTDWKWILIDINNSQGWSTITSFFHDLKSLNEFGNTTNEAEFSQIVMFFLIVTIIIGVFTYFSGIELSAPGASLLIIWIIVLLASAGGFLTFDSGVNNLSPWIEQFGFFFIYTLLCIGYVISLFRRTGE